MEAKPAAQIVKEIKEQAQEREQLNLLRLVCGNRRQV